MSRQLDAIFPLRGFLAIYYTAYFLQFQFSKHKQYLFFSDKTSVEHIDLPDDRLVRQYEHSHCHATYSSWSPKFQHSRYYRNSVSLHCRITRAACICVIFGLVLPSPHLDPSTASISSFTLFNRHLRIDFFFSPSAFTASSISPQR